MIGFKKWIWVAAVAVAASTPAFAQQQGGQLGGTQTGGIQTGGIQSGGGLSGGGLSGGGSGGQPAGSGGQLGNFQLLQMQRAPTLSPPNGQATSSQAASNFLSGYYANPYFQGQIRSQTNAVPGGFGTPLYPATGTGGTGRVTGTQAGRTTGLGAGRTGLGGAGQGANANQSGILIPLPVQINYAAELRFTPTPVAVGAIQTDLRGTIDRSSISAPQNVQIIVTEVPIRNGVSVKATGNIVTLRGTVKDEDEARLVEGLVALTPGVDGIRNELTFPIARK